MYFREHGVPHFHALYAEFNGVFDLKTLEMIEGDLTPRAQRLVRDWAELYSKDVGYARLQETPRIGVKYDDNQDISENTECKPEARKDFAGHLRQR